LTGLYDSYNRSITYLRVSVTDRCNFRCAYCMPAQGVKPCSHAEVLRYEEIVLIVRAAAELGIRKVRLTGGEPLVRAGLVDFVAMLAAIPGIDDLALSTNASLLEGKAEALKKAGLRRVNVSLDTLRPDRFASITGVPALERVLAGIAAAQRAGLEPVKTNTVAVRGFNDDELIDIASLSLERGWHVRFIELMPMGETGFWSADRYLSTEEIKDKLAPLGPLEPVVPAPRPQKDADDEPRFFPPPSTGSVEGPARYYRLPGASGTIGFISPLSEHFCGSCNRVRLTSDGHLRTCLLWDDEIDLRGPLRSGAGLEEIKALIVQAVLTKPVGHLLSQREEEVQKAMSRIGG